MIKNLLGKTKTEALDYINNFYNMTNNQEYDSNLLKEGKGDVFISAGNSGALLTGATLLVGRIKGIDRPALARNSSII